MSGTRSHVLLNQHTVPGTLLRAGAGPLLFDLGSTLPINESNQKDEYAWEFLAVVEHQLAAVDQDGKLIGDRHWTVVQEVRLLPPPSFGWFLDALARWKTNDPTTQIGYFGPALRGDLKNAWNNLPAGCRCYSSRPAPISGLRRKRWIAAWRPKPLSNSCPAAPRWRCSARRKTTDRPHHLRPEVRNGRC